MVWLVPHWIMFELPRDNCFPALVCETIQGYSLVFSATSMQPEIDLNMIFFFTSLWPGSAMMPGCNIQPTFYLIQIHINCFKSRYILLLQLEAKTFSQEHLLQVLSSPAPYQALTQTQTVKHDPTLDTFPFTKIYNPVNNQNCNFWHSTMSNTSKASCQ